VRWPSTAAVRYRYSRSITIGAIAAPHQGEKMNVSTASRTLCTLILSLAALQVAAQATVKVGKETKPAQGTVMDLNMGDATCGITLKTDDGKESFEQSDYSFCTDPKKYVGKRVALTYKIEKVQAESCQGRPECTKSDLIPIVVGMKLVAGPAAPLPPKAEGQKTFCSSMETVVFACHVSKGMKLVSVCANKDMLQYRFGKPDSRDPLEMMWPESWNPPAKVATGENVPFAGGGGAWLRIPKGDHAYVVYTGIGKWGPKGETRTKAGVVVERKGKAVANLPCSNKETSELGPDWFSKFGVTAKGQDFLFPD